MMAKLQHVRWNINRCTRIGFVASSVISPIKRRQIATRRSHGYPAEKHLPVTLQPYPIPSIPPRPVQPLLPVLPIQPCPIQPCPIQPCPIQPRPIQPILPIPPIQPCPVPPCP